MTKFLKKIFLSPWTALLTLVLVVAVRLADPAFVESVRLRYFDTLITGQQENYNNIYTVNIDDAAINKYGQWPFKRDVYANLIKDLYERNAGLVVFNVLMPERDRQGGDAALAQILKTYPVVLANIPAEVSKNTPRKPGASIINAEYENLLVQYPGIIANISSLESVAAGIGAVNTLPEVDGVNRRIPLVVSVNGSLYPNLTLEILRVAAGDPSFQIKLNELGVDKMRIPAFGPITTDNLGRVWIDWSQGINNVSMVNLPTDFGRAIVIVGVSATGVGNPVPTAKGAVWPQELQATVLATALKGVNIHRPGWADGAEIIVLILVGVLLIAISRWTYTGLAIAVGVLIFVVPATQYAYSAKLILLDASFLLTGLVLIVLHTYSAKFIREFLQKQQIKRQFGTYLSPAMVERLQKNPELLQLGGEERELSIMFTDVRGFTTISEHYGKDVQGLTKIMNRYMTAMTAKIIENEGTLDKYIGDAQMAFWNAPLDDPNHAKNAVRTALQMMESLDEFNKEVTKEGIPAFGMGLGINTGSVVVGNMGSSQRFDYTCLGDSVNLASRLEGQSKNYGVQIILGPQTAEQVKDTYEIIELDNIAVKGKTEGVKIYTLGHTIESIHQEFLKEYYQGNWKRAHLHARKLTIADEVTIKHYYELMIERLEEGKPDDWNGTYKATSK